MALQLPVYVRGINNLSDARYCAGMGADGLIFTLDPALPGALPPSAVRELAGWVAGVEIIGEFGPQDSGALIAAATASALDRVLLPELPPFAAGRTPPLPFPVLLETDVLLALHAQQDASVADALHGTDVAPAGCALLLTLPAGFEAAPHLPALHRLARQFRLWLGGHLAPASLPALLTAVQPAGVVLRGGDEIRPGLRDFAELEAVFEALEA